MDDDLIAPSLVCAEIGSAIWRAALRLDVSAGEARENLNIAMAHYRRIIPLEELADLAIALAIRFRHQSCIACFYVAAAERRHWH